MGIFRTCKACGILVKNNYAKFCPCGAPLLPGRRKQSAAARKLKYDRLRNKKTFKAGFVCYTPLEVELSRLGKYGIDAICILTLPGKNGNTKIFAHTPIAELMKCTYGEELTTYYRTRIKHFRGQVEDESLVIKKVEPVEKAPVELSSKFPVVPEVFEIDGDLVTVDESGTVELHPQFSAEHLLNDGSSSKQDMQEVSLVGAQFDDSDDMDVFDGPEETCKSEMESGLVKPSVSQNVPGLDVRAPPAKKFKIVPKDTSLPMAPQQLMDHSMYALQPMENSAEVPLLTADSTCIEESAKYFTCISQSPQNSTHASQPISSSLMSQQSFEHSTVVSQAVSNISTGPLSTESSTVSQTLNNISTDTPLSTENSTVVSQSTANFQYMRVVTVDPPTNTTHPHPLPLLLPKTTTDPHPVMQPVVVPRRAKGQLQGRLAPGVGETIGLSSQLKPVQTVRYIESSGGKQSWKNASLKTSTSVKLKTEQPICVILTDS